MKMELSQILSLDKEEYNNITCTILSMSSNNRCLTPEEIADSISNLCSTDRIKMFLVALSNGNDELANGIDKANEIIQQRKSKKNCRDVRQFDCTRSIFTLNLLGTIDLEDFFSIIDEEDLINTINMLLFIKSFNFASIFNIIINLLKKIRQTRVLEFKLAVLKGKHKKFLKRLYYTDKYFLKLDIGLTDSKQLSLVDKKYFEIIMESIRNDARELTKKFDNNTIDFIITKEK